LRSIDFDDYIARQLARASFDPQRRALRWSTLALALLTSLALVFAVLTNRGVWPAVILGALTLVSGGGLAHYEWSYRSRSGLRGQLQAGLRGQRRMIEILGLLDDRYYLINNLKLPGRADDVDHIIVGPNGVFAIETKNHRGRIYWQQGQWYQSKISRSGRPQPEDPIRDPTRQLKRNVDYLRSCINYTDPDLSRRTWLWIEGVVVFTHPTVSLDLPEAVQETLPFPALRARDLPSHILRHVPRRPYSKTDIRRIVSMFGHLESPTSTYTKLTE
jgi:hypothetical protein